MSVKLGQKWYLKHKGMHSNDVPTQPLKNTFQTGLKKTEEKKKGPNISVWSSNWQNTICITLVRLYTKNNEFKLTEDFLISIKRIWWAAFWWGYIEIVIRIPYTSFFFCTGKVHYRVCFMHNETTRSYTKLRYHKETAQLTYKQSTNVRFVIKRNLPLYLLGNQTKIDMAT